MSTSDLYRIYRTKAVHFADHLRETGQIVVREQYVNHWTAFGEALAQHKALPRQIGVGLSCTSVCDPWSGWKPGAKEPWDLFEALQ